MTNTNEKAGVWETIYKEQGYRAKYPSEDIIRFMAKNFYGFKDRKSVKILDLGCGPGKDSWFLAREGFDVYGIEQSESAIEMARARFANDGLKGTFIAGDAKELHFGQEFFDAVIDDVSLQHNSIKEISEVLSGCSSVLKKGGMMCSILRSKDDYIFRERLGKEIEPGTLVGISEGESSNCGIMHFFDAEEIKMLFSHAGFSEVGIEKFNRTVNGMARAISHYIVSARK